MSIRDFSDVWFDAAVQHAPLVDKAGIMDRLVDVYNELAESGQAVATPDALITVANAAGTDIFGQAVTQGFQSVRGDYIGGVSKPTLAAA